MLFNSVSFLVFFFVTYLLYRFLAHRWQNRILLVASYLFYGCWDWRFLSLIFVSTVVDYYCGQKIYASSETKKRKFFLWTSVCLNLGILAFFKYFNFFADNFQALAALLGLQVGEVTLNIVLPVGISFYTFQTMSYTIDIYRKKIEPERNIIDFALFVAFFPQLVAGPIERASRLLPQIKAPRVITQQHYSEGLWYISWGYFLKVFVADNMGKVVDVAFGQGLAMTSGVDVLLGIYAFTFQIFGDFAGYSFIAIGIAKWLGFNLMVNFLFPFFVTNPREYWKNWHISLSSWLFDYLYLPIGGSRKGRWKTARNIGVTFLLGGLWHGAAWTFVLWGSFHAAILILYRQAKPFIPKMDRTSLGVVLAAIFATVLMFHLSAFSYLFFRAESFGHVVALLKSLFLNLTHTSDVTINHLLQILLYGWFFMMILFIQKWKNSLTAIFELNSIYRIIIYLAMFYQLVVLGEFGGREFIYFQF